MYVSLHITRFTYDFATPFELAIAVFSLFDRRLFVAAPAAELVAAVSSNGADIALASVCAQRSSLQIETAEIWGLL